MVFPDPTDHIVSKNTPSVSSLPIPVQKNSGDSGSFTHAWNTGLSRIHCPVSGNRFFLKSWCASTWLYS